MHIRETRPGGEVLSAQWVLGEEVDMVGDDHQVTYMERLIHATGGIADEERLNAQFVHDTYGERHLLHRIALIEVETTLHSEDIHPTQLSENQFSTMSFHGGHREVRYIRIWELRLVSYF